MSIENSHVIYARSLQAFVRPGDRWLDVGCGHALVPDWLPQKTETLEGLAFGLDRDRRALAAHPHLRHKIAGDVHRLPFTDGVFDAVTANMVVEHVRKPVEFLREVHRVLRPAGRLLIHTPNAAGYTTRLARMVPERFKPAMAVLLQRREAEDVYPTFYRANTPQQLSAAGAAAALRLVSCEFAMSSPQLQRIPLIRSIERRWLERLTRAAQASGRPVLIAVLAK